jgi:hypothetical protein
MGCGDIMLRIDWTVEGFHPNVFCTIVDKTVLKTQSKFFDTLISTLDDKECWNIGRISGEQYWVLLQVLQGGQDAEESEAEFHARVLSYPNLESFEQRKLNHVKIILAMRQWDLRSLEKEFKRNLLAMVLQYPTRQFANGLDNLLHHEGDDVLFIRELYARELFFTRIVRRCGDWTDLVKTPPPTHTGGPVWNAHEKDILMDALYPKQRWNPESKVERPAIGGRFLTVMKSPPAIVALETL